MSWSCTTAVTERLARASWYTCHRCRFIKWKAVPVEKATAPDAGVGFPDGFDTASEPPRPMSRRDRLLLEPAGSAATEGRFTVALTGAVIEELQAAVGRRPVGTPRTSNWPSGSAQRPSRLCIAVTSGSGCSRCPVRRAR
ncbi:lantibiotic dehydratase [Streptomyces sp. NPDC005017]|uniref:lantibiotic dehydratase n=1 Tax=Streptomyces sp. NPDC005017 TaxID=3364706 RepID=UPI0036C83805